MWLALTPAVGILWLFQKVFKFSEWKKDGDRVRERALFSYKPLYHLCLNTWKKVGSVYFKENYLKAESGCG